MGGSNIYGFHLWFEFQDQWLIPILIILYLNPNPQEALGMVKSENPKKTQTLSRHLGDVNGVPCWLVSWKMVANTFK